MALGDAIEVQLGRVTSGISFDLDLGGIIAGRLTDAADGNPIPFATVVILISDGESTVVSGTTGNDGRYAIGGLAAGSYLVTTLAAGFRNELYDDIPCQGDLPISCAEDAGIVLEVSLGQTTADVDFALDRLGSISGTLTARDTGEPIAFADVDVWDASGSYVSFGHADATGVYQAGGLVTGSYFVTSRNFEGFQDELYDDIACPGGTTLGCDPTDGTPVVVSLASNTPGINFALERFGAIAGTLTEAATVQPVPFAEIRVYDASGSYVAFEATDASGDYRVDGLAAGTHFVVATDTRHFGELYDDLPCGTGCDPTHGSPVQVALGTTVPGIDFALLRLGSIAGTVTDAATGEPIIGAYVYASEENDLTSGADYTDSEGHFQTDGLIAGNYIVGVDNLDHRGERYDDIPCHQGRCDFTLGTRVAVALEATTDGINFALDRLGSISGRVALAGGGDLSLVSLTILDAVGSPVGATQMEASGDYTVSRLVAGSYRVIADHPNFLGQLYDGILCSFRSCDLSRGTPIVVEPGSETGDINFLLELGGAIAGRVTDAASDAPLSTHVLIFDHTGGFIEPAFTDGDGFYLAPGLPLGTYFASIGFTGDYVEELYDDIPCSRGNCDPTTGTPIAVARGTTTAGINFALNRRNPFCLSTTTAMCLADGRFKVEASWQDQQLHTGDGQAVVLTNDTGTFWFFDDANVELVVKVLDACFDPFDRFWVFAGGLTDVGVELTVTDTLTDEVKIYTNSLGNAFEPVVDTDAFATCSAGTGAVGGSVTGREQLNQTVELPPKNLTLDDGRFEVEAMWATANGGSDTAESVVLTDNTGFFWFFNADNVEVVVKVLDACELPGFNNYWVFAAGLTDVEVTLTVTDTVSGEALVYFSPLGSPFQPILDTAAFDTCSAMSP